MPQARLALANPPTPMPLWYPEPEPAVSPTPPPTTQPPISPWFGQLLRQCTTSQEVGEALKLLISQHRSLTPAFPAAQWAQVRYEAALLARHPIFTVSPPPRHARPWTALDLVDHASGTTAIPA